MFKRCIMLMALYASFEARFDASKCWFIICWLYREWFEVFLPCNLIFFSSFILFKAVVHGMDYMVVVMIRYMLSEGMPFRLTLRHTGLPSQVWPSQYQKLLQNIQVNNYSVDLGTVIWHRLSFLNFLTDCFVMQ